jgi:hypothetical protein
MYVCVCVCVCMCVYTDKQFSPFVIGPYPAGIKTPSTNEQPVTRAIIRRPHNVLHYVRCMCAFVYCMCMSVYECVCASVFYANLFCHRPLAHAFSIQRHTPFACYDESTKSRPTRAHKRTA